MTNPGGTFSPIFVISHRLAPFPPSSFLFFPSPSSNAKTCFFALPKLLMVFLQEWIAHRTFYSKSGSIEYYGFRAMKEVANYILRRCRTTSNRQIAVAAAAFSDSTLL